MDAFQLKSGWRRKVRGDPGGQDRPAPRVIPAGSTCKIREQEYFFWGTRAFPSYLQGGPSFFIEKSKRRMIAEDIAAALSLGTEIAACNRDVSHGRLGMSCRHRRVTSVGPCCLTSPSSRGSIETIRHDSAAVGPGFRLHLSSRPFSARAHGRRSANAPPHWPASEVTESASG